MKKLLAVLVGLVAISALAGTMYYLYSKSEDTPVSYKTETPAVKTIIKKTVATGSVVPRKEVAIKPQVSGIVDKLHVEPGHTVRAGDQIARIRIIPDMLSLNNAEDRVERARIRSGNAKKEFERLSELKREGAVSLAEFQRAELEYDNATQESTAALDNLELIRRGTTARSKEISNTLVRATISGMVLEVPLEEGDSVIESNTFNEGTTIATIADMDELVFLGKVDESEVGKIRPGMKLLLTIGAIEGRTFDAVLEHIAPKGIAENGAIQFEIRAALGPSPDASIRANLSANADIVLDRRDEVLAISESLLQFEGEKAFVEVETAPQQFEKRPIETGLSDGIDIEVRAGLAAGDRIKNPNPPVAQ
jgi:HlyD family secretion protein